MPHDPARERRTLFVARGSSPAENIDGVLAKLGGVDRIVGADDVVLIKVSAQWWNQGMTNVAAVRRVIDHVLAVREFAGEVIVFENTHFRLADGSGLSRAWLRPSDRNVDVPGWRSLGDLIPHFAGRGAPVSFVGLVDAGASALSGDAWHDPGHLCGTYGGDGRGPIPPGDSRDGYHWSLADAFCARRSLVGSARAPLTWPVFTSPGSGRVVDLRRGVCRRERGRLIPTGRRLTWIDMTTANEHAATGLTAACKSTMGVVDMSAGRLGTDPRVRDYQSVHYFGFPDAMWRMAGPLAHFCERVRAPDLYVTVAEWIGRTPPRGLGGEDVRLSARAAVRARTAVAGFDPVAIDSWCARNLLMPAGGGAAARYDLDADSILIKFLRYYRQVAGWGTMDLGLVQVV